MLVKDYVTLMGENYGKVRVMLGVQVISCVTGYVLLGVLPVTVLQDYGYTAFSVILDRWLTESKGTIGPGPRYALYRY